MIGLAGDFEVIGADDFLRLSKALKHAGRTELRKELNRGIRVAAKPIVPEVRAEALRRLPKRGGLARQVAKEPARVQTRTGRDPGVRVVVGRKRGGARQANRGEIRHPVFGDRGRWVTQRVQPGWFDDPAERSAPRIKRAVQGAMQDIVDEIVRDTKGGV